MANTTRYVSFSNEDDFESSGYELRDRSRTNLTTNLTTTTSPTINNLKNKNSIFLNFPQIPINQRIYGYYELNAQFHYNSSPDFDNSLIIKHNLPLNDGYTDAKVDLNVTSQQITIDYQPIINKLLRIYQNQGIVGVCEELTTQKSRAIQPTPPIVQKVASYLLNMIDFINAPINPWFISSNKTSFDLDCVKGEEWKSSVIKVFKWHPTSSKYAIATQNDNIKIFSSNAQTAILKHPKQIQVTCLAWKPFYPSILAVGCAKCIIIWDTDVIPVSIKPSSSCSYTLSKRYHHDIVDIQWYPKSDYLLSIASMDNQIIIWDISLKTCTPIKRVGNYGFSFARFTTNGSKLFTADLNTTFRIWNPSDYTCEKWSNLSSRCSCAAWSYDERILLYSCYNSSLLYLLQFHDKNRQETKVLFDLSSVILDNSAEPNNHMRYSVGGEINDICWDSNGGRLAISFKKKRNDSDSFNVVAIFITKLQPVFQAIPCGFVKGFDDSSWATTIQFKPNFDQGSLLTIAWSNGRVQYVPLYYSDLDTHQSLSNIGHFNI